MSGRPPVDNAQSHVTSFRPISEAAHSWSDDNEIWWPSLKNVALWRTQTTVLHLFCCMTNHTHPFNGPLSGTTRVSRYYQKGKTNLDFTEARQWVAVAPGTTQFFTGQMPFLMPNQQRQITEGQIVWLTTSLKLHIVFWVSGETWMSIICHLKIHTDLITVTWPCVIVMIHGWPWRVDHSIMMNVTWRHIDRSAKQLIVCHTTKHCVPKCPLVFFFI